MARLLEGHLSILDGFRGPGYHLAVAAVSLVMPKLFLAAKVVAILSAAAVLAVVFELMRRHIGAVAAWVTMLLVTVNAQFVLYTIQVGTDMYFMALAVATGAVMLGRRSWKTALAAGALAGASYLTRYNGLFLLVAGLGIMLFADRDEATWRDRIIRTAAFFGAAFVVILPWALFTWSEGYGFFYNNNYKNIAYEGVRPRQRGVGSVLAVRHACLQLLRRRDQDRLRAVHLDHVQEWRHPSLG